MVYINPQFSVGTHFLDGCLLGLAGVEIEKPPAWSEEENTNTMLSVQLKTKKVWTHFLGVHRRGSKSLQAWGLEEPGIEI